MKVSHTLICFFLLFSLQDGNVGLVSAQVSVYSVTEGENVTVECSFPSNKIRKVFCKEPCQQEDILIETTDATAQRGRYSSDYKDGVFLVTITQLNKSDSGRYGCGAGPSLKQAVYRDIEIIVVDAMLVDDLSAEKTIDARTGGNIAVRCNFTQYRAKNIKQLTQSDSGWYRCGLGRTSSKDPYQRFRLNVTDALTTSPKTTEHPDKTKEPHVETQCASAPEAEDDPSQHAYSEIKFVSVGSSHGGFHGDAECVFYSVPLVEASSDEPPLYSTVNNPQ
ncbi:Polymeric immunoglobulin receptor [Dissostichus eleginoides]|nr:Polymeric immunoglobulin receptor [Dissostichus eleginoides]